MREARISQDAFSEDNRRKQRGKVEDAGSADEPEEPSQETSAHRAGLMIILSRTLAILRGQRRFPENGRTARRLNECVYSRNYSYDEATLDLGDLPRQTSLSRCSSLHQERRKLVFRNNSLC